jgi:hypothetical protein
MIHRNDAKIAVTAAVAATVALTAMMSISLVACMTAPFAMLFNRPNS